MAYINAEQVKSIRLALKAAFPEYRFSVKKRHHSEVAVTVTKGPAFEVQTVWHHGQDQTVDLNGDDGHSINHYHTHWYGKYQTFFDRIVTIIKTAPFIAGTADELWFDKSDSQSDYFHTAYYMSVGVGAWDKAYEVTA